MIALPQDQAVRCRGQDLAETNARVIAENGTIASHGSAQDMTPRLAFHPRMFKAVTIDLMLVYLLTAAERRSTP